VSSWTLDSRKNATPSALMRGAILGAFRSGRYAKRSIATPKNPVPSIATANITMRSGTVPRIGLSGPPSTVSTPYPMNAPTMNTSPCAKLRIFKIP